MSKNDDKTYVLDLKPPPVLHYSYMEPLQSGEPLWTKGSPRKIKGDRIPVCPYSGGLHACSKYCERGSWSKDRKVFHPVYIPKVRGYEEKERKSILELMAMPIPEIEAESYPYKYKIYVAGSWKDRVQIRAEWMDKLEDMGHTITHDWTKSEEERGGCRDIEYHELCSAQDVQGVIDCDILLIVMDSTNSEYQYRGTFTELGVALGANKGRGQSGQTHIILYNPYNSLNDIDEMAKHTRGVTNVFYWDKSIRKLSERSEVFGLINSSTL